MAKLLKTRINKDDILEYLDSYSDFSFEIDVLKQLNSLEFICEHSGTYIDPITGKTREFDIRATKFIPVDDSISLNLCLSVECKNVREYFPLLFHSISRKEQESYLDIVWGGGSAKKVTAPYKRSGNSVEINDNDCPYVCGEYVAKSCDQVGRKDTKEKEIVGNDGDVFDKISQAINSSFDLIIESHHKGDDKTSVISIVLPFLVIPENKMWICKYLDTGERLCEPEMINYVTYFIGRRWQIKDNAYELGASYRLSHLEICSINYLETRLTEILSSFSREDIFIKRLASESCKVRPQKF